MAFYSIGADIGTSALKLVLSKHDGEIVRKLSIPYKVDLINGDWRELDSDIWLSLFLTNVPKLIKDIDASQILGIGITGQLHSIVFIDEKGNSIRPSILWNDKRTKGIISSLINSFSKFSEPDIFPELISTGSPAANLIWLKQNEPDNFKKIAKICFPSNYLTYKLTGILSTDLSFASTSCLYSFKDRNWSHEMSEYIGIDKSIYPEIKDSLSIVGNLTPKMSNILGLSTNVSVIVGTGDNVIAAISSGIFNSNNPAISIGTSGVFMFHCSEEESENKGKKILVDINQHEYCMKQGSIQACGTAINWWSKMIMDGVSLNGLNSSFDKILHTDLIFYPHILGEKTLFSDPYLKGAFINLTPEFSKEDLMASVFEGLTFAFKELGEKMGYNFEDSKKITIIGGGSQNDDWMQVFSDIFNKEIIPMKNKDPAYCIAELVFLQRGLLDSNDIINLSSTRKFIPDKLKNEKYINKYKLYTKIRNQVKNLRFK